MTKNRGLFFEKNNGLFCILNADSRKEHAE